MYSTFLFGSLKPESTRAWEVGARALVAEGGAAGELETAPGGVKAEAASRGISDDLLLIGTTGSSP